MDLGDTIEGKEFRNCEIVGPANLIFGGSAPGKGDLVDNKFVGSDLIVVDDDAAPSNVTGMLDCSVKNCTFYKVTILVPQKSKGHMAFFKALNSAMADKAGR